jgi:hypothetical protein
MIGLDQFLTKLMSRAVRLFLLMWLSVSLSAAPVEVNVPIPKGAEHIVVSNGDADLRKVFTYFPYPPPPQVNRVLPLSREGLFRIEVSPEGNVTAITILRTMGKYLDIPVMKTLVKWKAVPGRFRVVDVTWFYNYQPGGVRSYY